MTCAYCGRLKPWPAAFPSRIVAQCHDCVASHEVKDEVRRQRLITRIWPRRRAPRGRRVRPF